jgi:hypothetical protein
MILYLYNILYSTLLFLEKKKLIIYPIFLIYYFINYYLILIPQLFKDSENNALFNLSNIILSSGIGITIMIIIDILLLGYIITKLIFLYKQPYNTITNKQKLFFLIPVIIICNITIFFNVLIFSPYLIKLSNSLILKYLFNIFTGIFFVIFISLFLLNINEVVNIEFLITLLLIIIITYENILLSVTEIYKTYSYLQHDDFSLITVNCLNNPNENFDSSNKISYSSNPQIKDISNRYGATYLKTMGNIPVSFFNKTINDYQDLILSDFYYPGSYYSYLGNSPLSGTPNLEALEIVLKEYNCRIIHLDVYSDKTDEYDPKANPIIKCANMSANATPLNFEETMNLINKYIWLNNDPNNLSYPFFLYLNFNFNPNNEAIYLKIYSILLKVFSKYLVDKKYSFSGRNGTFPISMAKIKECLGKIIIITNIYPTKTALDEIINISSNNLSNNFNIKLYKESYVKYDQIGISEDNDKTTLLNNSKTNMTFYYSLPNESYKNNSNSKAGLYNPSFQDIAQYGLQGTLMYMFVPDDNLQKWILFFKSKNNMNPVLKEESLRYNINDVYEIKQQNPVTGLQPSQNYCLIPGLLSTEKSNVSDKPVNNSCK